MIKYSFWDNSMSVIEPDGKLYNSKEFIERYPWIEGSVSVIEYMPDESGRVGGIYTLQQLRDLYKINDNLPDEEALAEIEYIRNNPPAPNPDFAPLSRQDVQRLEQHITEMMLMQMEGV